MPRHTTLSPWFLVQALSKLSLAFFAVYAVNAEKSPLYENDSVSALADGGMQAYEMPEVIPEAHGLSWNESASLVLKGEKDFADEPKETFGLMQAPSTLKSNDLSLSNKSAEPLSLAASKGESDIAASKPLYDEKAMAKIKSLAAFDNFELIRPYIPAATNPQYQAVIYDIAMDSILKKQWEVVRGCMNLPEVDVNYRSAHYQGKNYLMAWLEAGEVVSVLKDADKYNHNLSDAQGRTLLHYLAMAANEHTAFGRNALGILEAHVNKGPAAITREDYSGKKPLDYLSKPVAKLTEKQDELVEAKAVLTNRFDVSFDVLMNSFRLEDNTNSPDLMTKRKQQFHKWWLANKTFHVPGKHSYKFYICLAAYGSYEDFRQILALDYISWSDKNIFVMEWLLGLAGRDTDAYKKVLALHQWNLEHTEKNIFAQVSSSGMTPIRYALEKLELEAKVRPFKELQGAIKNYIDLHHLGVIDIQAELKTNKPVEEIFASKESLQQALYVEVKRIKYKRPSHYDQKVTQQALKNYQMAFANKYMSEVDGFWDMQAIYALQNSYMFIDLRLVQYETGLAAPKYRNFIQDFVISASAIDFKIFVDHNLIDWYAPEFFYAVTEVLKSQDTAKAYVLYHLEKERSGKNIFYHVYRHGVRPVESLLTVPKTDIRYPSIDYLDELKALGIIDLEHDIKADARMQEVTVVTDNIELIKHYLPKVTDQNYNFIVRQLFKSAMGDNKRAIAEALLELAAVDINYQNGEDFSGTYLMYLVANRQYDLARKLLTNEKINVNLVDSNGDTAAQIFLMAMAEDKSDTPEAIALLKQFYDKPYLLLRTNYMGEQATSTYDHKLNTILGESYEETKKSFAAAQLDFLVNMKALYPKVEKIDPDTTDKDSQLAITRFKELYLTAVERGISYARDVKYVKKFMDCSSLEEFNTFLYYDMIPWHKPEYADIREHLLADVGNKESSAKVKLLHGWGKAHLKDTVLFDITNQDVAPIRSIMLKMAKTSSAKIKANIVPFIFLHYEGVINISAGLKTNKTVEEIFASGDSFDEVLSQLVETSSYNSIMLFANIAAIPMLALACYLRTRRLARRANPEAPREVIVSAEEIARTERVAQCKTQLSEWRLQSQASQDKASEIKTKVARVEENIASSGRTEQRELYTIACESQSAYLVLQQAYTEKVKQIIGLLESDIANPALPQTEALDLVMAEAAAITTQLTERANEARTHLAVAENNRADYERAERDRRLNEEAKARQEQAKRESARKASEHETKAKGETSADGKFNTLLAGLKALLSEERPLVKLHAMQKAYRAAEAIALPEAVKKPKLTPYKKTIDALEKKCEELEKAYNIARDKAMVEADREDIAFAKKLASIDKALQSAIAMGADEPAIKPSFERLEALKVRLLSEPTVTEATATSTPGSLATEVTEKKATVMSPIKPTEPAKKPWQNYIGCHRKYAIAFHSVLDICQRISVSLNIEAMKSQAPIGMEEAYIEHHQTMAINFNLARLFEQMASFNPVFSNLRNHLVHRFYQAQADRDRLFALAAAFTDEHVVLTNLHKLISLKDKSWINEIKAMRYYQENCHTAGLLYADELRVSEDARSIPVAILNEIEGCLRILQEFVNNIDESKSATMVADSKGLLTDHARMSVNILCHHFSGSYRKAIRQYFKERGVTNSEISAIFEVQALRNDEMHGAGAEVEGGMVGVKTSLDGEPLKEIYRLLRPLGKALFSLTTTPASAVIFAAGGISAASESAGSLSEGSFAFSSEKAARVNEEKFRSSEAYRFG